MGGGRGEGVEGAALTQGTQAWIMIIKRKKVKGWPNNLLSHSVIVYNHFIILCVCMLRIDNIFYCKFVFFYKCVIKSSFKSIKLDKL